MRLPGEIGKETKTMPPFFGKLKRQDPKSDIKIKSENLRKLDEIIERVFFAPAIEAIKICLLYV